MMNLKFCLLFNVICSNFKYKSAMKKLVGWRSVFLFGILFITKSAFAQIDLKRYHSSLIFPSEKKHNSQQNAQINAFFEQNKPFFLKYIPKNHDCFYLLASQTSICFEREINMEAINRQTKSLFFKMKMWRYFR